MAFGILQVEFEILHWIWEKLVGRSEPDDATQSDPSPDVEGFSVREVRRFDLHLRIQHFFLLLSFIVLALTGVAQKFYRSAPFDDLILIFGGLQGMRIIHRVAGFVLILDGLYHMIYLVPGVLTMRSGIPMVRIGRWVEMIPNLQDIQDFFETIGYFLGIYRRPPQYGHFSYLQKFDYWAVWWGLLIMAVSGMVLLLPALGVDFAATSVIAAALAAHSDEAILAISWIMIVHLYHAHLAPRAFPFNTTIFTGNISVEHLREEHPLEYEKLAAEWEEMPPEARPYRFPPSPGD